MSPSSSVQAQSFQDTVDRIKLWYSRREQDPEIINRWAPFQEAEVLARCQQYRCLAQLLRARGVLSLEKMCLLDVGCGTGRHVRAFLDYGADPENICGIDIREAALGTGKKLSPHLRLEIFDGIRIPFQAGTFDLVTQHVAVSSVLSPDLRRQLTSEMWRVVAPGGFIFWWDTLRTQGPTAKERGEPLVLDEFFPGIPREERLVAPLPGPDECLRPIAGARLLRALLRKLSRKAEHCAALIGPK